MTEKSYHHGDLKAELIREGLIILDREGYEGLSLRKVAKACGVSQTAPYRHFKDKNELVEAIKTEALRAFNQHLEQAVAGHPDNPTKQMSAMGMAYVQFFVENPEYLRLLFLSNYQNKESGHGSGQSRSIAEENPFHTYQDTVLRYYNANPIIGLEEMKLYSWGLVHGISILLANHEIQLEGDYHDIIRNIFEYGANPAGISFCK